MSQPTTTQIDALVRLWRLAQGDHGGANVACKLLLGLYNGSRFPFDLTEMRRLDGDYLRDALTVIEMDASPWREVHDLLNDTLGRRDIGPRLELLAYGWRLKGAVKKKDLDYLHERIAQLTAPRVRALNPGKAVHHINGDLTDNRPENLRLVTPPTHSPPPPA